MARYVSNESLPPMNLYDPQRQLMGTRPMVNGQQFVVPDPLVHPNPDGTVTLSIMLPSKEGGFCWHHATIPVADLSEFIRCYVAAPEIMFQADFGWNKVDAVFVDEHYTTQDQREEFYNNNPHAPRPIKRQKTQAPSSLPAGYSEPDLSNIDF